MDFEKEFGVTADQLLDVMRAEVGPIEDPEVLRLAFIAKYEALSRFDRSALIMRLGRRVDEEKNRAPGALFSPSSGTLLAASVLFLALSGGTAYVVFATTWWIALKIIAGLLGFFWLAVAIAGFHRVVFRARKGRDL